MNNMERLIEFIEDASKSISMDEEQLKKYAKLLNEIYSDPAFRHTYAEISRKLDSIYSEQRVALINKVNKILNYMSENNYSDFSKKGVFKLADHIELESIRLDRMDHIKYIGKSAATDHQDAQKLLDESANKVKDLTERIDGSFSQIITVLGIFAGIVTVFTSAVSLANETFSHIEELNFFKTILYLVIIGFVLYNTIFLMMYIVSKISGRSIAAKCKNKDCDQCKENCRLVSKFAKKYPYVLWMNILLILLMIILFITVIKIG